jgi:hypothetical protein
VYLPTTPRSLRHADTRMVFLIKWGKSPMTRYQHLRRYLSSAASKEGPPIQARRVPSASDGTSVQRARIWELCRLGRMREAPEVFDTMPHRDIIAWNSMILAYCNSRMPDAARSLATAVSCGNLRMSARCLMKCPHVMSLRGTQ